MKCKKILILVASLAINSFALALDLDSCNGSGGGENNCSGKPLSACEGYYRTLPNGSSAQCVVMNCGSSDTYGSCPTPIGTFCVSGPSCSVE